MATTGAVNASDTILSSVMFVVFFLIASVVVHATDHDGSVLGTQNANGQKPGSPGRNSESLPDLVVPDSLVPSTYILNKIRSVERLDRPELPDVAVRPERPERPIRPQKPGKPDKPGKP